MSIGYGFSKQGYLDHNHKKHTYLNHNFKAEMTKPQSQIYLNSKDKTEIILAALTNSLKS